VTGLAFLSPSPGALARSPMERQAVAAGAQIEQREGWNVAVRFEGAEHERVRFADMSHLRKIEVYGADLEPGTAKRTDGTWWCPYTRDRALVIGEPAPDGVDVTTAFAALAIAGPLARETFARFTALDLRDEATPVNAFRPGSVARTPGAILRQTEDRWLMLFGAALGQYMWTVVADAAESLGGGPVGVDALDA
jgi:glycine cleavage system aminomethyltransferase T